MRALISVSDKTEVVEFAGALAGLGCEIISTGGTFQALKEAGVPAISVSDVTGFPECLAGRVKTLHPAIHGGILAMRDSEEHMGQLKSLGIGAIDIVAVNLYPFKETILREGADLPLAIENIDIGGPAMLRSAAKNHRDVAVVCDPGDYGAVIAELRADGCVSYETRFRLALKAFEHTAAYDAMIAEYLRSEYSRSVGNILLPDNPTFTYEKVQGLRYGENPHQKAAYYKETNPWEGALTRAEQLHGKELSFNNINDADGALSCLREFAEPTVVAVKHANPCGVGSAGMIAEAWRKAYEADPVSVFGGIIAANRTIDEETAEGISKIFVEIMIAPGYTEGAFAILAGKQNIRLLRLGAIEGCPPAGSLDVKKVDGGILVQDIDAGLFDEASLRIVTKKSPSESEMEDLRFAMKVVKHVKSNAIVVAKGGMTLGIGPGQTNRIGAARIALSGPDIDAGRRDMAGAVMASDAYFPFEDCVAAAAEAGVTAIIQPGGSKNDEDSIRKCDELGIAMAFTGVRHFRH